MTWELDVVIFVIGTLDDLIDSGVLTRQKRLTEKGKVRYQELVESGFKATDEEMRRVIEALGKG